MSNGNGCRAPNRCEVRFCWRNASRDLPYKGKTIRVCEFCYHDIMQKLDAELRSKKGSKKR